MIIENGTVEFKRKTAGGIDPSTGYPVAPTSGWDEPVPCQWTRNRSNLLGTANGEHFTAASYVILIEERPLPQSRQVRLTDAGGQVMGEFSLLSEPEVLEAVAQIRLTI